MNASAQLSFPVVIIGAGPTGVTAATLLAQHGVQCLLLERWATVYPQPRAVHLDDEIYRILAQLGIAEQFATISRPGAGMRLLDHRGQILSQIARAPIGTHGYPQANMFDQPELEQLLRANLTNYPQVSLRGGVEVTTIAHISASQVQVTFTDRDSGDEHKVTATYVLGCDGANSVVRAAIGASMTARRFAQRWLVVDLNTDADLGHWDGVHHLCDPDRATTFMRVGERRYRWEFKLHPGETAADYDTVEKLRPLIAVWTGASAISELTLIRVTEYTFRAHVASHWRDRNVFILGDAAHLTPPFVGQGMGAGIRDAANLTWKLAGVLDGQLPTRVLDTYEQERKPHAWKMITIALAVGAAMTARGTAATAIRNLLVPRLQYIPGLRSRIQHSGTPALTRSALVNKTPRCRQLAGTQIPNLVLSQGHRIDTLLGSGFALVASETVDADQQAQLRRGGARAALIRPDRTVMQTARSPSQIAFTTTLFAPTHQPAPTYRETP
ncbi:bifunctional 3-(3-hydroxy-phenyl)propionate/3-hydroxycinnamic acid hydroxylase [Mycobacteroides abscessus]|uniref:bifunctional 3-(3-hydroxy-phenyl)propionate/3-hydroxycinnamic acid hydroxylase MhpA n=1 Tax=Mycobacteroides abscessus TaxID=36809 RepID=UPI000928AFE8|nr:bifunctional 3-(3-hydroxy-phenyl)propionate/3-hydroxycinnamic acid hydroxylase [Mycobacteroides abscessus]SID62715.1 Putative 3-(3-hydroxy-phenyl) propionate hydroxylase [Mycobacteroides abscessus subsp. abscessus]SII38493.1 Putative 3-(3-hydroxy-phenyl) propionate hydroxylase [Mycobacteroides abscessus subsp. abscessus]